MVLIFLVIMIILSIIYLFMKSQEQKRDNKEGIYGLDRQHKLFRTVLNNMDIKQNDKSPRYVLPINSKYSTKAFLESYNKYKPNVMFFVRNNYLLGSKVQVWKSLQKYYGTKVAKTVMPETFVFPGDRKDFKKKYKKGAYYILKNKKQRQEGIKLTKNYEEIMDHKNGGYSLIQDTITNPLLYQGNKFNVRIYLVIICDPYGNVNGYIYNDGIISYAINKYDPDNLTFENTISSFYNSKSLFDQGYCQSLNLLPGTNMLPIMKKKMDMVFKSVKDKLCYRDLDVTSVQLFGADFLIDDTMDAHLLEINVGPGMKPHNDHDKKIRMNMLSEMVELVNGKESQNYIPLKN